jgi:hypothetical protein
MQDESKQFKDPPSPYVEHLIVLLALDRRGPFTRAEVEASLADIDAERVRASLKDLESVSVVVIDGEYVRPSQATARLDRLHMICI